MDVLVGGSGRVGRLILPFLRQFSDFDGPVEQFRKGVAERGFRWDPLDGPLPLLRAAERFGGFQSMVVLAGSTPGPSWDKALNLTIAQACLEAAKLAGIRRVLIASSSAVYGICGACPLSETDPCLPISPYGFSKLEMENACYNWRSSNLEICCLRIGNVAGADALLSNVLMCREIDILDIDVFENGRGPLRSYIGPESLAWVLYNLCRYKHSLPPILNVAAPRPVYMEDLIIALGREWRPRHPSKNSYQNIYLDCSLLDEICKFRDVDSLPSEIIRQFKLALDLKIRKNAS